MGRLSASLLINPPLLFAAAFVCYIGQNGGLGLAVSLAFFVIIAASILLPAVTPQSRHWFCHKATPQALVAALCASAVPVALIGNDAGDSLAIFLASTALYTVSNICTAYQFARDFRPWQITPVSVFLVPQLWGMLGHTAAMLYNGGVTIIALPLVMLMGWLAIHPRIGSWHTSRATANYLGAAYNVWFILCNATGPAPNAYMIISCALCVVACCLLARRVKAGELAEQLPELQEAPMEPVLVELPNLSFSLPALPRDPVMDGLYVPLPLYFSGR